MTLYSYVCIVCGCPDTRDEPNYCDACPKCASRMECIGVDQAATDRELDVWFANRKNKAFDDAKARGLSDEIAEKLSNAAIGGSPLMILSGRDREILCAKVSECDQCGAALPEIVYHGEELGFFCSRKCYDEMGEKYEAAMLLSVEDPVY